MWSKSVVLIVFYEIAFQEALHLDFFSVASLLPPRPHPYVRLIYQTTHYLAPTLSLPKQELCL